MNTACSTCLESFNLTSNISTTPCGHVFHTDCIKKWFQSGQSQCPQCRKLCGLNRLIKLYFSESESEYDLVRELEAKIWKLEEEVDELKSVQLVSNFQREQEKLNFQNEKLKFQNEKAQFEELKMNLEKEKLELRDENRKLSKHLYDEKSNTKNIERGLQKKCVELTEKVKNAEQEVKKLRSKSDDAAQKNFPSTMVFQEKTTSQPENFSKVIGEEIEENDAEACKVQ